MLRKSLNFEVELAKSVRFSGDEMTNLPKARQIEEKNRQHFVHALAQASLR